MLHIYLLNKKNHIINTYLNHLQYIPANLTNINKIIL